MPGLVNSDCVGVIGNGCVVHVPSFFEELDALEKKGLPTFSIELWIYRLNRFTSGLDCTGRLLLSDRAHLVFDFHQIVDGLKEVELGGSRYSTFSIFAPLVLTSTRCSIGTTKKGIGPTYSGKASRSGLRVHHLFDHETFATKFRKLVEGRFKRYGHFEYDTEAEIERYKVRPTFPVRCPV